MMRDRDFDAIAIRDLARAGGCSVGSFYYRFGTKEEFFDLLLDDMIAQRQGEVQATLVSVHVDQLPAALARGALATHRANAGLLRSAIKKQLAGEGKWERVSAMGRRIAAGYSARVVAERDPPPTAAQLEHIAFSFMWLYGLLTQSVMGLNTIFGMESAFFEQEAVTAFERSIADALRG